MTSQLLCDMLDSFAEALSTVAIRDVHVAPSFLRIYMACCRLRQLHCALQSILSQPVGSRRQHTFHIIFITLFIPICIAVAALSVTARKMLLTELKLLAHLRSETCDRHISGSIVSLE